MGKGKARAQAHAKRWWNSSQGKRWQQMGAAKCDVDSSHRIAFGQGYLCKPLRPRDNTPDLVCERCFDSHPYQAWDLASDEAITAEATLAAQTIKDALSEPQPGDTRRTLMGIGGLLCVVLMLIGSLLKGICYLFGWAWLAWLSWLAIVIVFAVGLILIVGAFL